MYWEAINATHEIMINHSKKTAPHYFGFTLIELMIVLAVASILVTVGIPSFMSMTASNRVTTASNSLVTVLNLAKSEAIRSGTNAALCQSADEATCGGDKTAWKQGWILFSDSNGNNDINAGERIIRVQGPLDPSLNFTLNDGGHVDKIYFTPLGRASVGGTFCFENNYNPANSRKVVINRSGRFYSKKHDTSDPCSS